MMSISPLSTVNGGMKKFSIFVPVDCITLSEINYPQRLAIRRLHHQNKNSQKGKCLIAHVVGWPANYLNTIVKTFIGINENRKVTANINPI